MTINCFKHKYNKVNQTQIQQSKALHLSAHSTGGNITKQFINYFKLLSSITSSFLSFSRNRLHHTPLTDPNLACLVTKLISISV